MADTPTLGRMIDQEFAALNDARAADEKRICTLEEQISKLLAPPPPVAPAVPALKAPVTGFVPMDGMPPRPGWEEAFDFMVFMLPWKKIEPRKGQYDKAFVEGLIEKARSHGKGAYFRWASGVNAPAWLMADDEAGSVQLYHPSFSADKSAAVRYWEPAARDAYAKVQVALAEIIEPESDVAQLQLSPNNIFWSEVFSKSFYHAEDPNDPCANTRLLRAAGFTVEKDLEVLLDAARLHKELMPTTWAGIALTPYTNIDLKTKHGCYGWDIDTTLKIADELYDELGPQLNLSNHGMGGKFVNVRDPNDGEHRIYKRIQANPSGGGCQITRDERGNNFVEDMENIVFRFGLRYVEIRRTQHGGADACCQQTLEQMIAWADRLRANAKVAA